MNATPLITVTGGTGTIGSELLMLLSAAGADTRAIHRRASNARHLPNVSWVVADLRDPAALQVAIAGTTRLFLLTGNEPGFGETQIEVIRAAEQLGVQHIVKLSALGASDHSKSSIAREHWTAEQALVASGVPWTILRPHAFMQNWLDDVAGSVRDEGVIYAPIADGRVPFIDTRDIAAVAAMVLLHPEEHVGKKYFLTGGEAVGYAEVASALSDATGRSVTYRSISMEEARSRLTERGVSEPLIEAMLAIAAYQKAGGPTTTVSPNVERLLGRPPRTIRDFARDHATHFMTAPSAATTPHGLDSTN
ncbi:MAG TPA: SDR family oxidoreductase [Gemmatimonadaceae bacterium]|nr:SDR family oxidoreductase [Gemmatimonadaceae bacterium]